MTKIVILFIALSASDADVQNWKSVSEARDEISCDAAARSINANTKDYAWCEVQFLSED